jgi:GNAT superfamily N-acetyltransferase
MSGFSISRAGNDLQDAAYAIVTEYYAAVGVELREDGAAFGAYYFGHGSGLWLASSGSGVVGCIALRPLVPTGPAAVSEPCGEVKRLYVRPLWRGKGIADKLLDSLHEYAASVGYRWLYLDSKDDLDVAIRFYQRRGYQVCERYNNNPQATVFMRRMIAP